MKKTTRTALTLALALGLSVNAYAAAGAEGDTKDVYGTYEEGQQAEIVYSVDISWDEMTFTYKGADEGTWNPETYQYEGSKAAGWVESNCSITITNHSNTAITATASYQSEAEYASAGVQFDNNQLSIGSADNGVDGGAGQAVEGTIKVTPTGTLDAEVKNAKIGSITIVIE